jgi:hypothetical protein
MTHANNVGIRLRTWVGVILVPIVLIGALAAPAYVTRRVNDVQLSVTCQSARSNAQQLKALRSIAVDLGIPVRFTIPSPPPECDGR